MQKLHLLSPAVGEGYPNDNTVVSGGFAVSAIGANRSIPNGTVASTNIIDSSLLEATTAETQWKLFATTNASPVVQGSGVYDPRAGNNFLSGDEKALAICEVCWILPDSPPERQDVALQPDGVTESSVYTSTQPR